MLDEPLLIISTEVLAASINMYTMSKINYNDLFFKKENVDRIYNVMEVTPINRG